MFGYQKFIGKINDHFAKWTDVHQGYYVLVRVIDCQWYPPSRATTQVQTTIVVNQLKPFNLSINLYLNLLSSPLLERICWKMSPCQLKKKFYQFIWDTNKYRSIMSCAVRKTQIPPKCSSRQQIVISFCGIIITQWCNGLSTLFFSWGLAGILVIHFMY